MDGLSFLDFIKVNGLADNDELVGTRAVDGKNIRMSVSVLKSILRGRDGASVQMQYSATGQNWHYPAIEGDKYLRVKVGDGEWSVSFLLGGPAGESAYQTAVRLGYTGTEDEWLASLQGISGKDGTSILIQKGRYREPGSTKPLRDLPNFDETQEGWAYLVDDDDIAGQLDLYMHNVGSTEWEVIDNWAGIPGTPGVGIKSTVITYQAANSGTTAPAGTWTSTIPSTSAGQYLWTKTVITYTNNTVSTSYSVSRNGSDGLNGRSSDPSDTPGWLYKTDEETPGIFHFDEQLPFTYDMDNGFNNFFLILATGEDLQLMIENVIAVFSGIKDKLLTMVIHNRTGAERVVDFSSFRDRDSIVMMDDKFLENSPQYVLRDDYRMEISFMTMLNNHSNNYEVSIKIFNQI